MKDHTASDHARLLRHLSTIEPRPEVLQRALERTRDALTDRVIPTTRVPPEVCRRSGRRFLHFAAAIAIVLIAAVGGTCLLFFATPGTTSAFAQVQLAIKQVPSVAFSVKVIKVPKGVVSKSGTSVVDLAGNCSRFESADGVDIDVFDNKRGAWMHLDSIQKRAVVVRNRAPNRMPSFAAFLEALRDCDPDTVEQVEDAIFDGQTVKRYRVLPEAAISGGVEMLVSVDPKTHLPVRIECTTDKIGGLFQVECRDFSFDQRDPSLFAVVPPQGYTVDSYDVPSSPAVASTTGDLGPPMVSIEIRLTENTPSEGLIEATVPGNPPQKIYLHADPIVTCVHIENCRLLESRRAIELTFTNAGRARMVEATSQNMPKQLAVLIEGKVVSAPVVRSTISETALITGTFSPDLVHRLSATAGDN